MVSILKYPKIKKAASIISKERGSEGIVRMTIDITGGSYLNGREIETRKDRFIYNDGKVLTKIYRNNRLCMITAESE